MMVSGAVQKQPEISDLEKQLHHSTATAKTAETLAAQLNIRQKGAGALDLKRIGTPAGSDGQASGFPNSRFSSWMLT